MDHALTCKTGRFASLRQNEIVNDTADVLSMVYKGVRKEPTLSTAPNSNDKFQTEISVCSFWQRLQRLLVGVTISYPFAPSYRNQSLAITIKTIKNQKERKCNQLILDGENSSFTPLEFTTNSGIKTKTKQFYRRLSQLLCEKSDVSYSDTNAQVKQQIRFSLLRTSIFCSRGSQLKKCNMPKKREWTLMSQIVLQILQKLR